MPGVSSGRCGSAAAAALGAAAGGHGSVLAPGADFGGGCGEGRRHLQPFAYFAQLLENLALIDMVRMKIIQFREANAGKLGPYLSQHLFEIVAIDRHGPPSRR